MRSSIQRRPMRRYAMVGAMSEIFVVSRLYFAFRDNPIHVSRITIKRPWRNMGFSLGLDYPYIYGQGFGHWLVWHRHTGVVAWIVPKVNPQLWEGFEEQEASIKCHALNGCTMQPDAETLDAIDSTP